MAFISNEWFMANVENVAEICTFIVQFPARQPILEIYFFIFLALNLSIEKIPSDW